MKIYLDIDDTLINTSRFERRVAGNLKEFLTYMLENHDVYWLTTHCDGDATTAVSYMSQFVDSDVADLIMRIQPTRWKISKTEAINMGEDFLWFDDTLSDLEEKALRAKGKLGSYIKVNLDENPNILLDFIEKPNCKAYVIDILKRSYMLHIWTWPKFSIGWHRKIDGPNKRLFGIYKW